MKIIKYSLALSIFFVSFLNAQTNTGNVGVNTNEPKNTLDIRGNLKVTPDEITPDMQIAPLYIDTNAGEGEKVVVTKISAEEHPEEKPFLFFDLVVKLTKPGNPEVVFDTNIPASDYNLFVTNSELLQQKNLKPVGITHTTESGSNHINQNPIKQVDVYVNERGKWSVFANFPGARFVTADSENLGEWIFSLVATKTKNSAIVDPNPNYNPSDVTKGGAAQGVGTKWNPNYQRHYPNYDPGNPQNPAQNAKHSLRGDAYKLNSGMTGSANYNPLQNY